MRAFDIDAYCEIFGTLEQTIESLLLTSYSIQNGTEIDVDDIVSLTPRLAYAKAVIKDEIEYQKQESERAH